MTKKSAYEETGWMDEELAVAFNDVDFCLKIREKGYETINVNGGFLGIVVDKNIKNVDITIDYIPRGYNVSCQISIYSGIIYLMLLTIAISICYRQRRRKYEENLDYSSLL